MTDTATQAEKRPLTVAILAVGGQGGGVLSNWLLALAESNGWRAQTTSVPGVAQRTGATVYYLEMVPADWESPVLGLMPGPASVDVIIAAELMEAGRAIQRGLVAPDRSTVIASSHRSYAVLEKMQPGDGTADSSKVLEVVDELAARFLHADMQAIADRHDSMISASLFGAVAAADVLPFERASFEQTIKDGKVGVANSLAAFADAFDAIAMPQKNAAEDGQASSILYGGADAERQQYEQHLSRLRDMLPVAAHSIAQQGLDAVIDFQDARYGGEYLDHLHAVADAASAALPEDRVQLLNTAARYLAQAMVYDDIIRVADLKTRAGRFDRIKDDVRATNTQIVHTTEFFHPRLEEVCGTLPAGLGAFIENTPWTHKLLVPFVKNGRRIRSSSTRWFLVLYCIAGLRRWRRGTLRHQREQVHMRAWLTQVIEHSSNNIALAQQILKTRRLIKGYSDTHARGTSKFDRVMAIVPDVASQPDAAATVARLIDAALADASTTPLDAAIADLTSRAARA